MKSLFHDEEETLNRTEHGEADGYALVRHLGYVPRCLCLPLVVNGMTQSPTELKGPG